MRFSLIIPVFNRPDEVEELLDSLTRQHLSEFEVIIVEDGSDLPCANVVEKYKDKLDIHYFFKLNSGPGQTRNYGAEKAKGDYLLILDSDIIVPEGYLEAVEQGISKTGALAFGGPDRAHPSFTPIQKAISYSMTSFFTTGGIRGGKKKMDKFYPRSFNMGVKREVYLALGGFSSMRFGEDIDFSIRLFKAGYACQLFRDAWVFHKRRSDFNKFFKQVHNSGIARINLYKKYPESLKLVHLLPAVFTLGVAFCALLLLLAFGVGTAIQTGIFEADPPFGLMIGTVALLPLLFYSLLIFIDSLVKNKSLKVAFLSIPASFIQLLGYGTGFLRAWWSRCVKGRGEMEAFKNNFYK